MMINYDGSSKRAKEYADHYLKMVRALEFYASTNNYETNHHVLADKTTGPDIFSDKGQIARDALGINKDEP